MALGRQFLHGSLLALTSTATAAGGTFFVAVTTTFRLDARAAFAATARAECRTLADVAALHATASLAHLAAAGTMAVGAAGGIGRRCGTHLVRADRGR